MYKDLRENRYLVEFALDLAVGRAEYEVRSVVVILHGGRERAALGQLFLQSILGCLNVIISKSNSFQISTVSHKIKYLAETAPQDIVAGAEDVNVVFDVHPIDGVSPKLMGNWNLLNVLNNPILTVVELQYTAKI